MVKSSNFYSFSSSSSSSDDHQSKRKRHVRKEKDGGELARECGRPADDEGKRRHHQRHDEDRQKIKKTTTPIKKLVLPAALSDYDELRAHYRFVLPDDDDETIYNNNNNNTTTTTTTANDNHRKKYGSTWQERMVKNYHQGLYKEYVLADLSRVVEIGKIGLRWRTEVEVSNGRGFRSCGNLTCQSVSSTTMTNISTEVGGVAVNGGGGGGANKCDATVIRIQQQQAEQEAYKTAARRHVGIGVPENGGKEPMGMFLPPPPLLPPATNATYKDNIDPLDQYLRSCHDDALGRVRGEDKRANDSDDDNKKCRRVKNRRRHSSKKEDYKRRCSKHNMQKFSHSRRRRRSEGHSNDDDDDDDDDDNGNIYCRRQRHDDPSSLEEEQERNERTRLSDVRHGIGLHDYEVDFAYIECGIQKRELVKVRLCLRCAPLLFVARNNSNSSSGSSVVVAPAMKARLAREDAAMRNRAMLMNGGNNIVIAE
jgi:protein FRA10AC1